MNVREQIFNGIRRIHGSPRQFNYDIARALNTFSDDEQHLF